MERKNAGRLESLQRSVEDYTVGLLIAVIQIRRARRSDRESVAESVGEPEAVFNSTS
jgi:hypothetical protein